MEPDVSEDEAQIQMSFCDEMARIMLPKIQSYYDSDKGQAAFKAWKAAKETGSTV